MSFSHTLYIKLEDNYNRTDIIKLTSIGNNKTYKIYNVSTKNSTINNLSKDVKLSLFYFLEDGIQISDSFDISLDYSTYNFTSELSVLYQASKEISELYEKIYNLSKMNINIYEDILEVTDNK